MGDPYTQLLDHRIIFLGGEVNDSSADAIVSHLLLLDASNKNNSIRLFIKFLVDL